MKLLLTAAGRFHWRFLALNMVLCLNRTHLLLINPLSTLGRGGSTALVAFTFLAVPRLGSRVLLLTLLTRLL